jgi:flagellar basal body-associated protein FliL
VTSADYKAQAVKEQSKKDKKSFRVIATIFISLVWLVSLWICGFMSYTAGKGAGKSEAESGFESSDEFKQRMKIKKQTLLEIEIRHQEFQMNNASNELNSLRQELFQLVQTNRVP